MTEQTFLSQLWGHLDLLTELGVTAQDFNVPLHQRILLGLQKQALGTRRVAKLGELADYLGDTAVDLFSYLKPEQRLDKVAAKGKMELLLRNIRRDNQRNAVVDLVESTQKSLNDNRRNPWNVTADLAEKLSVLARQQKVLEPVSAPDVMEELLVNVEDKVYSKIIPLGIPEITKPAGDPLPGHVWLVGGYTGTGKSLFSLNLMLNAFAGNKTVVCFSTEMTKEQTVARMLAYYARIPNTTRIFRNQLDKEERVRLEGARKKIHNMKDKLFLFDNVVSAKSISSYVRVLKANYPVQMVVVDFIQGLHEGRSSEYENMTRASMELQRLAIEESVFVLIVSQVSNTAAESTNTPLIGLKGSGALPMIGDVVLRVKRGYDDGIPTDEVLVIVRKSRHGNYAKAHYHIEEGGKFKYDEFGSI